MREDEAVRRLMTILGSALAAKAMTAAIGRLEQKWIAGCRNGVEDAASSLLASFASEATKARSPPPSAQPGQTTRLKLLKRQM